MFTWKTFPEAGRYGGEDGGGFEDWISRFDLVCYCNGCLSDDDKSDALLLGLKGDAARYVMGIPDFRKMTYSYLCLSLKQ